MKLTENCITMLQCLSCWSVLMQCGMCHIIIGNLIGKSCQTMRKGYAPFCSCIILFFAVQCGDPTPENGSLIHTNPPPYNGGYRKETIVIYNCDSGYDITGSVYSYCVAFDTWEPAPPTCTGNNSIV